MQEKMPGSDTYRITAVDEGNENFKRLYLSPSAREASMTNTSKTVTWTTLVYAEDNSGEDSLHRCSARATVHALFICVWLVLRYNCTPTAIIRTAPEGNVRIKVSPWL